jgi:hypothetical protein
MKKISSLTVMCLIIFLFIGGVGRAEQHDRLLPLLGNLERWQTQPAKGMSLVSAQMKMISASRIYNQADKNLNVTIMVNSGPVLDSDLQESSSDNEVTREQTQLIDGFWVKSSHNKKSSSGELIVYLDYNQDASGLLVADYSQMSDDEVLKVVRSMDWVKIKGVVSKLL